MKNQFIRFLIRWFANGLGLYVAAQFFGLVNYDNRISAIIIGSLILSILNAIIKPVLVVFTLPAIVLTLGIFMIVINGLIVYLASIIYHPLDVVSFWAAMLVGIVIGLINYMVTLLADKIEVQREHA